MGGRSSAVTFSASTTVRNDDVVQSRFGRTAGFERAFRQERDLFYQAAAQKDSAKQRVLVRRGLDFVRQRHTRYFTGSNRAYAEIESLFLTMEGAGPASPFRLLEAALDR